MTRVVYFVFGLCALCFVQVLCNSQLDTSMDDNGFSSDNHRVKRKVSNPNDYKYDPNCEKKYKDVSPQHAMCFVPVGIPATLTQEEKQELVDEHNRLRGLVSPTATNMQKMYWNEEIAKTATKWASQCVLGHDKMDQRKAFSLPGISVGQNMAYAYRSFKHAIQAWHNEVKNFRFGRGSINRKTVGHYTQVVQGFSPLVGCGQAKCETLNYYVCNYGRIQRDTKKPYTQGATCDACKNNCKGKQCDCKGKICSNEGVLDLNTCKCKCPGFLSGDTCAEVDCEGVSTQKSYCKAYATKKNCQSNFWRKNCPFTCGDCPYPCNHKICQNGGKLNVKTCKCACANPFTGDTCTQKNCKKTDSKSYCPTITNRYCNYGRYKAECPIRCGICPKPCAGKECANGGTVDVETCECRCKFPWTDSKCLTKGGCRPKGEESYCVDVTKELCKWNYYKKKCNIKCGICPK